VDRGLGVARLCEMTASSTMWLQLTVACFAAMLVPTLIGDTSIPDSLKDRLLAQGKGVARLTDQLDASR
jgi:H+/Cl- antiporter ClcA